MYLGCAAESLKASYESTIASLPIPYRQRETELSTKTPYYDITHKEQVTN